MQVRSILIASVLSAVVAAFSMHVMPAAAAPDHDECLAGPSGQAPDGSRWRYRLDRIKHRQCWYLSHKVREDGADIKPAARSKHRPASDIEADTVVPMKTRLASAQVKTNMSDVPAWSAQDKPVNTFDAAQSELTNEELAAIDVQNDMPETWPAASNDNVKPQPDPSREVLQVLFAILAALIASLLVRLIITFVPARPARGDYLDRHNGALSAAWPYRVAPTFASATRTYARGRPLGNY